MPTSLPDVRPLIINLLSRYIIQCKLSGSSGLPGQRSEEKWYSLLEALCLTVQPQTNLSHCTLQFMRYVSLLEQVCELKEGQVDQSVLDNIFKLLTNLALSSELREEAVTEKLVTVLERTRSGLAPGTVEDYGTKVSEFVRAAMEQYTVVPLITLTGDAFMPAVSLPGVVPGPGKQGGRKPPNRRGKKRAREPSTLVKSEPKKEAEVRGESSEVVRPGGEGGGGSGQDQQDGEGRVSEGGAQDEGGPRGPHAAVVMATPVKSEPAQSSVFDVAASPLLGTDLISTIASAESVLAANIAVSLASQFELGVAVPSEAGGENQATPTTTTTTATTAAPTIPATKAVRTQLDFDPPLPEFLPLPLSKENPVRPPAPAPAPAPAPLGGPGAASLAGRITTPPSLSVMGELTNHDTNNLVHIVNVEPEGGDSRWPTRTRQGTGSSIFDRIVASSPGAEMGWTSDESTSIHEASPAKRPRGKRGSGGGGGGSGGGGVAGEDEEMDMPTKDPSTPGKFKFVVRKGAWSEEESRCLLDGVEKFGEGKWKEIREEAYSVLRYRTTNQLKDKYRNMKGRPK